MAVYQLNGVFGTGQQLHTLIEKFRQRIGAAMREVTNDTNVHEVWKIISVAATTSHYINIIIVPSRGRGQNSDVE